MAKSFTSAAAFKSSLEARLRTRAADTGIPFQTVQLKFVMERLLARLFQDPAPPWLLKGGFAMDLRYRPQARTTKDIDLSVSLQAPSSRNQIRELIQAAADRDLGDHLTFRVGRMKNELTNAPQGGGRFPCEAVMLGKVYARFNLDVGIGDAVIGTPDQLIGDDILDFAGIRPAHAWAIPRAQQFAEKVHAFTFPWNDRLNTRTKDLVDLVLMIERGPPSPAELQSALRATFSTRATHPLPDTLPSPPDHWAVDFPTMAAEAGLSTADLVAGFQIVQAFWSAHSLGKTP